MKIAYIQRLRYPDPSAAALQSISMAAAFSKRVDTTFFVHDVTVPERQIRDTYSIKDAPLHIQSLYSERWPKLLYHSGLRHLVYNGIIALLFGFQHKWHTSLKQCNVLFVRSRREILFWGLYRSWFPWLRNWIFICELHDLMISQGAGSGETLSQKSKEKNINLVTKALKNFDLVLPITRALGEDLVSLFQGKIQINVVTLSTGLSRLDNSPVLPNRQDKQIVLGYIGTIDQMRGTDQVFQALRSLPSNFVLRVVGVIKGKDKNGNYPEWLSKLLAEPSIAQKVSFSDPMPYHLIATEIDSCDIVLQPAGLNEHAMRYAAPLKLFDYMARGKPIIAADVPAHKELLQDGVNARLYRAGEPENLAAVILSLAENLLQQQEIAIQAWKQSINYTYEARAKKIINLIEQKWQ